MSKMPNKSFSNVFRLTHIETNIGFNFKNCIKAGTMNCFKRFQIGQTFSFESHPFAGDNLSAEV